MLFPLETLEKLLEQWIKQGNVLFSFPLRHDMNCTSRPKKKKKPVLPRPAYIPFWVACTLLSDTPLAGVWSLYRMFVPVWTASKYRLELAVRASSQWEASTAAALARVGKKVVIRLWLCGQGCPIRWDMRWPGPRGSCSSTQSCLNS